MLALLSALMLAHSAQPASTPQPWEQWVRPIVDASAAMRTTIPVVDQVVLVPDLPTLLDELGRWSPEGHWPILIKGEPLNELFIRRFAPARVLERERVVSHARREQVEAAVAAAWNVPSLPLTDAVRATLKRPVPGIVLADERSGARAAAALLAAGRGQHLGWVNGDYGRSGGRLSEAKATTLRQAVEAACTATGEAWSTLGDGIDTVTMCRDLAARVNGGERIGSDNAQNPPALAVTDVIGRHADGRRWAFAGWMFGDAGRSAWAANCSLFLPRRHVWMGDSYPDAAPWTQWKLASAAKVLQDNGYTVRSTAQLTPDTLTADTANGLVADLVFVVSKGNADFFRLAGDLDVDAAQVPALGTPAAVYMVHSWSLRAPYDAATVGGRWVANGAYADVGSSQEPMLSAFVPPELVAKRLVVGLPWLIAGRFWPGEGGPASKPWRVNTIGDPLMIAPPPTRAPRSKRPPADALPEGCANLTTALRGLMAAAQATPDDETFAAAITNAAITGRTQMAAQLYGAALQEGAAGVSCATAAMPSLVFQGRADLAANAAGKLAKLTRWQGDLLWSVGGPLLAGHPAPGLVQQLERALDVKQSAGRVRLLAHYLRRTKGAMAANALVQRYLDQATSNRQKRELKKLLQG